MNVDMDLIGSWDRGIVGSRNRRDLLAGVTRGADSRWETMPLCLDLHIRKWPRVDREHSDDKRARLSLVSRNACPLTLDE